MRVTVLGGGSWGIGISNLLAEQGHGVWIYDEHKETAETLQTSRQSPKRLPGVELHPEIHVGHQLQQALAGCDILLFAVPSSVMRTLCQKIATVDPQPLKGSKKLVVSLVKGIENGSLKRMSEIIQEELKFLDPSQIAVLSGPSHAEEVARKNPTSVVISCSEEKAAQKLQEIFATDYFRTYWNTDTIGVELCGTYKNVIAIACGIVDGLGLGDNTKGALLTRGLAEMTRLGERLGANSNTFFGLSGLGDLVTTCISQHSRNRFVGEAIGKGEKLEQILAKMNMVAEGVPNCRSIYSLSLREQVELPISEQVYKVLFENKSPELALRELMTRSLKGE